MKTLDEEQMIDQSYARESIFFDGVTYQNCFFLFQAHELTTDFCREVEGLLDEKNKRTIERMIQRELFFISGYNSLFYKNCAKWLQSTKIQYWDCEVSIQQAIHALYSQYVMIKHEERVKHNAN